MEYFLSWALVGAPFLLIANSIEKRVFHGSLDREVMFENNLGSQMRKVIIP